MPKQVTIAVDAMGGDYAPASVVEGALLALRESPCSILLVGDETIVRRELERWPAPPEGRLEIVHAEEVVSMDDPPVTPIRKKPRSSIRICANLVREGRAQGMFSAGNTGAVMIAAKMVIGTIEGVDRPALAAVLPNQKSFTLVLDVGANVDTKVEHLRQFAVMGHFYAQEILHTPAPRIGLLSIGEEQGKGTDFTRQVFKIMESLHLNFVGNVEGRDVFRGSVDVIVCDGFVGNVMLKSSEALGEMISRMLEDEMRKSLRTKLGYLFAKPAFKSFVNRLDYSEYGAAPLLGVKGGCFIGHGVSNAKAVKNAVLRSSEFCAAELHQRMREKIAEMHVFEERLESPRPQGPLPQGPARTAFVFPGQGSQSVGMGKACADEFAEARAVFATADSVLGFPLSRLCWEGPDAELQLTANTQPAVLTMSIAVYRVLVASGRKPDVVAGHSLGEYSALVAAGALDLADAVALVRRRGQLMQEAVPAGTGAMAAFLGADDSLVREVALAAAGGQVCSVANLNAPGQTVIAGHREAVERAIEEGKKRGARKSMLLAVSAPFHCALMAPARAGMEPLLAEVPLRDPEIPVVCNVDARPLTRAAEIRDALLRQIDQPVRWVESVECMRRELEVGSFVEIGPGRALAGMIKRIVNDVVISSVSDPASVRELLAA